MDVRVVVIFSMKFIVLLETALYGPPRAKKGKSIKLVYFNQKENEFDSNVVPDFLNIFLYVFQHESPSDLGGYTE